MIMGLNISIGDADMGQTKRRKIAGKKENSGACARGKCEANPGEFPLASMRKPGRAVIARICCANPETKRLRELGLVEGRPINLLHPRRESDPAALRIGESRLCISHETAQHLWMEQDA
ncbi:MAG: FeoA family protein [Candidatus Poribacteria bacterium]|nr:FeoA family protein [Candidatus Poribacteria bacterium]